MEFPIRINKYLAEQGLATRRGADALIEKGEVFINGKKAVLGTIVNKGDKVELRGAKSESLYLVYYKPYGVITHSPAAGEVDIATRIKEDHKLAGVFPIGRLDKDSEGLIILTNDGRITKKLTDADEAMPRSYKVTVDKPITSLFMKSVEQGVKIEGYTTKPAQIEKKTNATFIITLTETKKHQLKRMCAALGYQIKKVVRTHFGGLELGDMKAGQYRILRGAELKNFLKIVGVRS